MSFGARVGALLTELGNWMDRHGQRFGSAVVALLSGGLLGVAAWLEPAVAGHGTHEQLGLDPCTFLALTDVPCPMCGATTTFSLMADLRWIEGILNQPFAAVLFLVTVGSFSVSLAEALAPRGRWAKLSARLQPYELRIIAALGCFMLFGWIYKWAIMAA